ncbi:NifB/NifX family molybdenum-iron cluster-binding protein [Thermodesulforhabdus norvegica]|uniref:Predicted Fe-Mo cluster-binding protein, NifX family n=1 Tax=Thermodesulforhabdus norvegica TaxID=39841 RepID=A0A1I4VT45_9BACT|nr:NifB/NifX family molybdenum-iron cluster-binding protein [Thermodesulforhabdus norvegica]SFN04315.1 Predicted Fe-Mo cluster-binding protein, NifX family [Thermodesulforhabdus norvegica]
MKIAIPLANGRLSMHFGHSEYFALIEVDPGSKKILKRTDIQAPPHQPGLLPRWMADQGVNVVIAGGMGQRAISLFEQLGIRVFFGAPADYPENLVRDYLEGTLIQGPNVCDH